MRSIMKQSPHYLHTVQKRYEYIIEKKGEAFFKGKTLLEVGCFFGDFANLFSKHCSAITCSDLGPQLDSWGKAIKLYSHRPEFTFKVCDLNTGFPTGHWDICLNLRSLHHLEDPAVAVKRMAKAADFFIIESGVLDSSDPKLAPARWTTKNAYLKRAEQPRVVPTREFLESQFEKNGLAFERLTDLKVSSKRIYDFKVTEDGEYKKGYSGFWFAWPK